MKQARPLPARLHRDGCQAPLQRLERARGQRSVCPEKPRPVLRALGQSHGEAGRRVDRFWTACQLVSLSSTPKQSTNSNKDYCDE